MSDITIVSTDTPEQIASVLGNTEETPSEAAETEQPETAGDSETPEEKEQEEEEQPEEKPQKKGGFQRRIDKLTRANYELQQRLAAVEGNLAKPAENPEPTKPAASAGKPKLDDFQGYDDYVEALTEYKVNQAREKEKQAEQQKKAEETQQTVMAGWNQRLDAARNSIEDFDEVLEPVMERRLPPAVLQTILESEKGPELAYALAKDANELERILKLSPLAAAREIGKLEAKLSSKPAEEKKSVKPSEAPAPINPVGKGKTASTKNPDEMDFQEYKLWRQAQLKRR